RPQGPIVVTHHHAVLWAQKRVVFWWKDVRQHRSALEAMAGLATVHWLPRWWKRWKGRNLRDGLVLKALVEEFVEVEDGDQHHRHSTNGALRGRHSARKRVRTHATAQRHQ